jgi:replicative DNA helicase
MSQLFTTFAEEPNHPFYDVFLSVLNSTLRELSPLIMSQPNYRKRKWRSQKESYQEALDYMRGRQNGTITSIKTPWKKFNDAIADGIEWNSTTVIAARPGTGKTLIKDQIIREAFALNKSTSFRVLEFSLEMVGRVSAMRSFSSFIGRAYKYLCSADGVITDEDMAKCYAYAKKMIEHPIDIIDEPCTVTEFRETIAEYMDAHSVQKVDKAGKSYKEYTKTIITLDHSLLLKKAPFEKDKHDTLFALGEALTDLKRKYPIAFIVLSQLNRDIDRPERNEDGKYGNHILESDIYGSDALLQHADTVVGVNRPAKQKIQFYGVERYIIEDLSVLVFHFIKARNGDTRMSFMRAEFDKMQVSEMDTPPTQERKITTRS